MAPSEASKLYQLASLSIQPTNQIESIAGWQAEYSSLLFFY